jgi:hypothetical protein
VDVDGDGADVDGQLHQPAGQLAVDLVVATQPEQLAVQGPHRAFDDPGEAVRQGEAREPGAERVQPGRLGDVGLVDVQLHPVRRRGGQSIGQLFR